MRANSLAFSALILASACMAPGAQIEGGKSLTDTGLESRIAEICPGGQRHLARDGSRTVIPAWTIMHYAAADSSLEKNIVDDIDEMERGFREATDNVNVIVQLDKASETGMWRYRLGPDQVEGEPDPGHLVYSTEEEPDSGNIDTLLDFARWAITCFPAENYMFIAGGHGGGWSVSPDARGPGSLRARQTQRFEATRIRRPGEEPRGELPPERMPGVDVSRAATGESSLRFIAPDNHAGPCDRDGENCGQKSRIYTDDLADALKEIRKMTRRSSDEGGLEIWEPDAQNRLVAYGSDACLMGTAEVTWQLRNGPRYVIGSSETEPGTGWPYYSIIRYLVENSGVTITHPDEVMRNILKNYRSSYSGLGEEQRKDKITLAVSNTRWLRQAKNNVEAIVEILVQQIESGTTEGEKLRTVVARARDQFPLVNGEAPRTRREVEAELGLPESSRRTEWERSYKWGDGYGDFGLFFISLRYLLLEEGYIPMAGQTDWAPPGGTSNRETLRRLGDKLHDLLDVDGPNLVIDRAMGDAYPHARGLSVFMTSHPCTTRFSPEQYEASDFNQATNWMALLRLIEGASVSIPEDAYGKGSMELAIELNEGGGFAPVSASPLKAYAECEYHAGKLFVYMEGTDGCMEATTSTSSGCFFAPDVSFDINDREVTRYLMWSKRSEFGLDYEDQPADGVAIAIADEGTSWVPGELHRGSFTVEFPRRAGSEDRVRAQVSFECSEFRVVGDSTHLCR